MSELDTAYHDAALKLGMSDSVMLVLYTLCPCGGECMIGDITSGASKQTINSALRKLESEGSVYLEIFEGRKKKVHLTEKGGLTNMVLDALFVHGNRAQVCACVRY